MIDGNQLREEFGRYLAEHKATRWGMDAALMHVCKIAYDAGRADGPGEHLNGAAEILDRALSEHMKRSVKVEQTLLDIASGRRPMLTPDECRMLSLALGTPDEAQTDAQRAMLAAGDHMKEAERLSRVLEDIAQTALRGVDNEQIRGHLMDASALLAHFQRGAPDGWKEATIAWEVCASIHREYAKKKDPFFSTRQADFVRHTETARAAMLAAGMVGEPAKVPMPQVRWATCPETDTPCSHCPTKRIPCQAMTAPAEVPMPKPVAYGFGNTAITGHTNRLMMVRIDIPGGDQYAGALWLPLVLADEARTYGAACRAAGEAAGYARGLAEAGRDAERSRRWISVTDENPGQGPCIVFSTWGVRYAYRHNPAWMDGFQDGETKIDEGSDHPSMTFSKTFRVTHWMPWPSPPIAAMRGEVK